MLAKSTFFLLLTACYFIFGASGGADTTESGFGSYVTQVAHQIGDMVTRHSNSSENTSEGMIKKIIDGYSFLARPVADRLRTHRWFPRLNRIVGIIFSTVMITIAGIVAGAGGTALGGVLILFTIVAAAFIIAATVVVIVTLTFLSIFL